MKRDNSAAGAMNVITASDVCRNCSNYGTMRQGSGVFGVCYKRGTIAYPIEFDEKCSHFTKVIGDAN